MKTIIKAFFCNGDNKFSPVYFWITILMGFIIAMLSMRFFQKGNFSDTLLLGVLGFIVAWVGLYNKNNKEKIK